MEKFQFTTQGVRDYTDYLYQQSDAVVQLTANAFSTDLKGQVDRNFNLDEGQRDFLLGLDAQTTAFTGSSVGMAMAGRLPINLQKPLTERGEKDPVLKVVETKPKLVSSYSSNGETILSGEVTIEISYHQN